MKLDNGTIAVLQNFQSINPSIVINPGNIIRTISPAETVFAKATLTSEFPKQLGIYDLSKFLGILSLNKNSEIVFKDDHMIIQQDRSKVRYTYCNVKLINAPPSDKEIELSSIDVRFELKANVLNEVIKAMSILRFNEICFEGSEGVLSVQAISTKNDSSDVFSTEIGVTDKTFSAVIEADKLKLISNDYTVSITREGIAHFTSPIVEYWVAISTKSSFN